MKQVRVLLVEDHGLVRAGFRALLDGISGVHVVGEAADGRSGLSMIRLKKPHVVFMDIALPGLNGLEVLERVVKEHPKVQVVMLSMHANEEYVSRALRSGARGYVLKDADISELELALRAVTEGNIYMSPAVSKSVVDDYMRRVHSQGSPYALTERQEEVLQQVARGKNTKEIAYRPQTQRQNRRVASSPTHEAAQHSRRGRSGPLRHPCRPRQTGRVEGC